jgi:hypothetical protein
VNAIQEFEERPGPRTALHMLVASFRSPIVTFGGMPRDGSPGAALVYGTAVGAVALALQAWVAYRTLSGIVADRLGAERAADAASGLAAAVVKLLGISTAGPEATPVVLGLLLAALAVAAGGLIVTAAFLHLSLRLGLLGTRSFTGTLRVTACASASALVMLIPVAGFPLSVVVITLQQLSGLAAVHDSSAGQVTLALARAALVVGAVASAVLLSLTWL